MKNYTIIIFLLLSAVASSQTISPYGGLNAGTGPFLMSQSPIIPGVKARVGAQFNFNGKTDVIAAFDCGTYYTPLEKTSIYSIGYRIEFFYQRDSLSSIKPFFGFAQDRFSLNSKERIKDGLVLNSSKSNWFRNYAFLGFRYFFNDQNAIHAEGNLYLINPGFPDKRDFGVGFQVGYSYFFKNEKAKPTPQMKHKWAVFQDVSVGTQHLKLRGEEIALGAQFKFKLGVQFFLSEKIAIIAESGIVHGQENKRFDSYTTGCFSIGPKVRFPLKDNKSLSTTFAWNWGRYRVSDDIESSFHPIPARPIGHGFSLEMEFDFGKRVTAFTSFNRIRFYTNRVGSGYNDVSGRMMVPGVGLRFYLYK